MKRIHWLIALVLLGATTMMAQEADPIATGLGGVASIAGETRTPDYAAATTEQAQADSVQAAKVLPVWKQKLYYGYDFDIYYHNDTRSDRKENGWSIAVSPELGWRLKERVYLGLRFGGSYQDTYTTISRTEDGVTYSRDIRVQQGSWEVTPYVRYRMKTMFEDKVGIWLEAHLYAGMEFPSVAKGFDATDTEYDGLRHSITYGVQVSPVITYQFNKKSTFQVFFSILSLGYSGTTFCYMDDNKKKYNEYTHDVIIFSGKLRNLVANHFTPGLYGLKFGVQKSF